MERKSYGHIKSGDGTGALRISFLSPPPVSSLSSASQCLALLHFAPHSARISYLRTILSPPILFLQRASAVNSVTLPRTSDMKMEATLYPTNTSPFLCDRYFDEFKLCSAALRVRVCEPQGDGISSLQHLLDSAVLRGRWDYFSIPEM
jgi:hypothetical protein